MRTIRTAFTRAATGVTIKTSPGVTVYWLLVFALAILDDSERRATERRRKRDLPLRQARGLNAPEAAHRTRLNTKPGP